MSEIAEMTLVIPGSMNSPGVPSYPWSPADISEMGENERKSYLRILREYREKWSEHHNKK
tara:strand:+ start:312 stop:491 length:180 start_codon:yes stop_codon:yes gene_type:complete